MNEKNNENTNRDTSKEGSASNLQQLTTQTTTTYLNSDGNNVTSTSILTGNNTTAANNNNNNNETIKSDVSYNVNGNTNTSGGSGSGNANKYVTRLPWGALKEKPNLNGQLINLINVINENGQAMGGQQPLLSLNDELVHIEKKKPGEYLMKLIVFNYVQICSKKLEQILNGDKRVNFNCYFSNLITQNLDNWTRHCQKNHSIGHFCHLYRNF